MKSPLHATKRRIKSNRFYSIAHIAKYHINRFVIRHICKYPIFINFNSTERYFEYCYLSNPDNNTSPPKLMTKVN